jgi:hypothetical protein
MEEVMGKRARGIIVPAVVLVVAAILGGGCHDPFSNQWFEDDALFLAAIPDAARVTTRVPQAGDAERRGTWGEDALPPPKATGFAEFPLWTWEASYELNSFIFMLLYTVEWVTAEPSAWRSQDERLWGPIPTEGDDAIWFEMIRAEDRFDYSMEWRDSDTDRDGGIVPFRGSFVAGSVPREGIGDFRYDFGLMNELEPATEPDALTDGVLSVQHDNRDGQVLLSIQLRGLVGQEGGPWDADYAFFLDPGGPGWFEYAAAGNVEQSDPQVLENYEIRTRWQADFAGRGDARISGGELGAAEFLVTECWDADLRRTYYADTTGYNEPWGDLGSCVYADEELPTHL